MDFGIFDHVERHDSDLSALYEGRLRMLEIADQGGYFCYHVAEHQGTPLSMAPSPSVLLAAVAQRTTQIKMGPLCYILPLYDPVRLVNEICMLDQMSQGRLQVGIGRGVSPIELGFFGVDPKETRGIFEENLEIIRLGLVSDTIDFDGKYHSYKGVPSELSPYQKPYPPFWYPTSGLGSIPWVAENSFDTVFLGAPNHVADQVKLYLETLPNDSDRARLKRGMLRYVFVAETDAEALRVAKTSYQTHLSNLHHLAHLRNTTARSAVPDTVGAREGNPPEIELAIEKGWAAVGSPATVIEQISAMQESTGCNYLIYNPLLGDTDIDFGLAAVELFADQVLPALKAL